MRPSVACIAIACALLCAAAGAEMVALSAHAPARHPAPPSNHAARADPRDLRHCRLTGAHPAGNDIRIDTAAVPNARPVPIPLPVTRAILDHVSAVARSQFTVEEWREARQRCRDVFFSPVLELPVPTGLALYVVPRAFPVGGSVDYFMMYDSASGAFTRAPPLIYTKWSMAFGASDTLLKSPAVRFEAAAAGRRPLLVVEERTHNGNVYDAAVYRYFEIGEDMSLTQVLAVEARAELLGDREEYTEREATFLSPDRVRLDVRSRSPRHLGSRGSVLLEREGAGKPFHVARRMPAEGQSGQGLVTYCDTARSDDEFLRVGCDFYY
jgi:hypothetical protein